MAISTAPMNTVFQDAEVLPALMKTAALNRTTPKLAGSER
jgi:hypothetical protein